MSSTIYRPVDARALPLAGGRAAVIPIGKTGTGAATASRSGVWVAIFAITMSFAAFTSALFVREGSAGDWGHLILPRLIYANTFVLLLSSVTLEIARRRVAIDKLAHHTALAWMAITFGLGLLFVAGQYQVWRQLAGQGLYLATNPNSSFFYVFTGMHMLHVLGGIAALIYLIGQLAGSHTAFRRTAFENTAVYWHFMAVLWMYLLFVLRTRL